MFTALCAIIRVPVGTIHGSMAHSDNPGDFGAIGVGLFQVLFKPDILVDNLNDIQMSHQTDEKRRRRLLQPS